MSFGSEGDPGDGRATRDGRDTRIETRRSGAAGGAMSGLAKIYTADNGMDAHMLKALLEQEGISAVVRGDDVVPLQGGALFRMEVRPSVWVFDDDRRDRAQALADEYGRGAAPSSSDDVTWDCPCGESVEAQFSECWSCGRSRADP
ncbi:MAG TPA: DUF2007 domain-containing protein [Acidobacteria bacterium]|nr:DUF2007 domain-containing protein [Acidobacteriota bacterium]